MTDFSVHLLNLTLAFFFFFFFAPSPFYKTQLLFIVCRLELHITRKNKDVTLRHRGSLRRCALYEKRNAMTANDHADKINYNI